MYTEWKYKNTPNLLYELLALFWIQFSNKIFSENWSFSSYI